MAEFDSFCGIEGEQKTDLAHLTSLIISGVRPSKSSFLAEALKLFECRKRFEDVWKSLSTGRIELMGSVDLVETAPGMFNPSTQQISFSGSIVSSMEELLQVADAARVHFASMFEDMNQHLALDGIECKVGDLKNRVRALEKARDDYDLREPGPGISWLFDIVRGSILCSTEDEILQVVQYFQRPGLNVELIRLKNRFSRPTPGGFRDINMNVKLNFESPTGSQVHHVCEIQVHCMAVKDLCDSIDSHDIYKFFRTYFRGNAQAVDHRMALLEKLLSSSANGSTVTDFRELTQEVILSGSVDRMEGLMNLLSLLCEYDHCITIKQFHVNLLETSQPCDRRALMMAKKELSELYFSKGMYRESESLLKSVFDYYYTSLGPSHRLTRFVLNQRASIKKMNGEFQEAKRLFLLALAGKEDLLSPSIDLTNLPRHFDEDLQALIALGNYATLLSTQGQLREAQRLYTVALTIKDRSLGPNHVETLSSVHGLASVSHQLASHDVAKQMYERALDGFEKAYGPEHVDTLSVLSNYGVLCQDMGDVDKARQVYNRVVPLQERILGANNRETLLSINHLASILKHLGEWKQAEELYKECLRRKEDSQGLSISTLATVNNLGVLYQEQGRYPEAKAMYLKSKDGYAALFDKFNQNYLISLNNLGEILVKEGLVDEAESYFQESLNGFLRLVEKNHYICLAIRSNIADISRRRRQYSTAKNELEGIFNTLKRSVGITHDVTLDVAKKLVALAVDTNDSALQSTYEQSIPAERQVRLRVARMDEIEAMNSLIAKSASELSVNDYTAEEIASAVQFVFGVDSELIEDESFFVMEDETRGQHKGEIVACGGWSRRSTLFGSDSSVSRSNGYVDPHTQPAKIRAFFVRPTCARKGLGSRLLRHCEKEAKLHGFTELELMATLPGLKLYQRYGYSACEEVTHVMPNGVAIRFVRMKKCI